MSDKPWEDFKPEKSAKADGPWNDYQPEAESAPSAVSQAAGILADTGLAGARSSFNGLIGGYAPQIAGLARAVMPDPLKAQNEELRAQGFRIEEPEFGTYLSGRDETSKLLEEDHRKHPYVTTANTIAGGILGGIVAAPALAALTPGSSALLATKAAQGAGLAGKTAALGMRALGAGYQGAALGALSNPGDHEGEVDPLQLGPRAKNAAIMGAVSVPLHMGAEGIAQTMPVAKAIKDYASEKYAKAIGLNKAQYKKVLVEQGKEGIRDLGRTAKDEGLIPFFATPGKIAARAEAAKGKVGQELDQLLTDADAAAAALPPVNGAPAGRINSKDLAAKMGNDPEIQDILTIPGNRGDASQVQGMIEDLERYGPQMNLKDALRLKMGIDNKINYNKAIPEMSGSMPARFKMRTLVRDAMNDTVNNLAPQIGASADDLLKVNRRYGKLSQIEDIATNRDAMNEANRAVGLTDTIAAGAGGSIGAAIGGHAAGPMGAKIGAGVGSAAGLAGNKFARTYGPGVVGRGADLMASLYAVAPKLAAEVEKNPAMLPMVIRALNPGATLGPPQEVPASDPWLEQFKVNPALIDTLKDETLKAQIRKRLDRNVTGGN